MQQLQELFSAKETATFLGVSRTTLWRWTRLGALPVGQKSREINPQTRTPSNAQVFYFPEGGDFRCVQSIIESRHRVSVGNPIVKMLFEIIVVLQ
jgi:hypothetical protein